VFNPVAAHFYFQREIHEEGNFYKAPGYHPPARRQVPDLRLIMGDGISLPVENDIIQLLI
jgi:hypothetical protein